METVSVDEDIARIEEEDFVKRKEKVGDRESED
jgi:hypothetical protein